MRAREDGFTLIELLVVVLVIAVLASIAVPVFYRQREKGYEAQMQSSLKQMAGAIEAYAADPAIGGSYSGVDGLTGADLAPYGFRMPDYLTSATIEANATEFCIEAEHASIDASSEWKRATYDSANGRPVASPDHCPKLI